MIKKLYTLTTWTSGITMPIFAIAIIILAGCQTPSPTQKCYATVLPIAIQGDFAQWATNNESLQALSQSFTKVLCSKRYTLVPIVYESVTNVDYDGNPDALNQLAVKLGKDSKVEYVFLAVLNQAATGTNGEIHLNIVSTMFKLGNDYEPDEIVATSEWPEGGKLKPIPGGRDTVIEAIQMAAEEAAAKYPDAVDLTRSTTAH